MIRWGREKSRFPNDANGAALRRMAATGDSLRTPRDIDFIVVMPDEESANRLAATARSWGHPVTVEYSAAVPELPWDVAIVNCMLPTHASVTDFECVLAREAARYGGRNDGWGSLTRVR